MTEQTRTIPQIPPHGDTLVDRVLRGEARAEARQRARRLKAIPLTPMAASDVELLASGAFSPLTGFMTREDYETVVEGMRLQNGLVWSIPVTMPVTEDLAEDIHEGDEVALVQGENLVALMTVAAKFPYDKRKEAQEVYRTTDKAHPGVARLYRQGEILLGGEISLVEWPLPREFPEFRHTPAETRRMFARRGWRRIVGFQTRNPIHRAHEYIQKTALEVCDGLLLHPLVGETKADDIPPDVRMASYQALLRDYYPPDRVILGVFPAAMRYAGPREAIFHAICRKNYGCTHFIVGRDHAGVRGYYGTYDAQQIFDDFSPWELDITPLFFEHAFYCKSCGGIVSAKTCPHDASQHVVLSGTQVRQMLEDGQMLPEEFTRPEVSRILLEGVQERKQQKEEVTSMPAKKRRFSPAAALSGLVRRKRRRVLVVGLDCADPHLVFGQWKDELPHLRSLWQNGIYGELTSTVPAITVPAWSSMLASKDPGQLGFYGFRNRADYSYDRMTIATGNAVRHDRVWDILGRAGQQTIVVGVPQTYPVRPVNGLLVSGFLTPSTRKQYTHPDPLRFEIDQVLGGREYDVDVPQFRTEDKDHLLRQIYDMTEKHFEVVHYLLGEKAWDFFMFVEMGIDRIHHGFWKFHDPAHPKYEAGNRYEHAIRDYYVAVDQEIGQILEALDDDTVVLVVSDHGVKKMDGGICVNEWLRREGLLVLMEEPRSDDGAPVPFEKVEVDWSKTRAWGAGGYYARIFLNVEGREPQGVIPRNQVETFREELAERLRSLPGPNGEDIGTVVFRPEETYREINNIPPDLIVYFGNLNWRSVGSFGFDHVYTFENDIGPDDANHAQEGMFIVYDPRRQGNRELRKADIMDIAPTILDLMGVSLPEGMAGRVIGE